MATATDDLAESFKTAMADAAQDITHLLSNELKTRFDSAMENMDKIAQALEAVPGNVSVSLKDYMQSATQNLGIISKLLQTNADRSFRVIERKVEFAMGETSNSTQSLHSEIAQKLQSAMISLTRTVRDEMNAAARVVRQEFGVPLKELTKTISHDLSRQLESAMVSSTNQLSNEVCNTIKDKMELPSKDLDDISKLWVDPPSVGVEALLTRRLVLLPN